MAVGKTTKERILHQGVNLLSRGGFAGVTLGTLAQQAGMSKSGLFAHFRSKDDVQLELLDATARIGAASFVGPAMRGEPGLARLRAVVNGWFGWTAKAGLTGGCPVAAGMFELDDAPEADPVRQHLLVMEKKWRSTLMHLVNEAVQQGDLQRDLDVNQFVWELCGIYLNHHASHRFIRDPHALDRAQRAFHSLIGRSRPSRTSKSRRAKLPQARRDKKATRKK
jgi:AcrR family transcriptional regulator